jgi:hypothetical protein
MRNKTLLAGAASIALICTSTSANADEWYVEANDGTCVSAKFLSAATSGFGWASPYTMADGVRATGVDVHLETTKIRQFLMIAVRIGAVPDAPSLDHANFLYFNDKDVPRDRKKSTPPINLSPFELADAELRALGIALARRIPGQPFQD